MPEETGRTKGTDEKFCYECGEPIRLKAEICPKCGVRQPYLPGTPPDFKGWSQNFLGAGQPRTRVVAGLIAVLGGGLGLHKFYLGKPGWGIVYIVFIWTGIPVLIGLVEGIFFLTMTDPDFERRYGGPAWR